MFYNPILFSPVATQNLFMPLCVLFCKSLCVKWHILSSYMTALYAELAWGASIEDVISGQCQTK
jgi:hypothetical protein